MKKKKKIILIIALILTACLFNPYGKYFCNLMKWKFSGITHYRYTLHYENNWSVTCSDCIINAEVKNGEIVPGYTKGPLAFYSTIDRFFYEIRAHLTSRCRECTLQTTYHLIYGYPLKMCFDPDKYAFDDIFCVSVSNFEILK